MSTSTTVIINHTENNATDFSLSPIDVSSVDEITLSINCDQDTSGIWILSRLDAFAVPILFQEGSLFQFDQALSIGPSASYDLTNSLGDALQLDIQGANGSVAITVCITGKAYA